MFIRADAIVDEIDDDNSETSSFPNGGKRFEVTVTCPDRPEWTEKYTLAEISDTKAAQAAIDRFVTKYATME
jgi:hypothetical protein